MIRMATPTDADAIRVLFREYADGLGIDLSFQDFEALTRSVSLRSAGTEP